MTSAYNEPSETVLRALFDQASYLLLDFDGPLCRLFAPGHARAIARSMLAVLEDRGERPADLTARVRRDPHLIVRAELPRELTWELEVLLAEEEEAAALTATPTAGAAEFVGVALEHGRTLAITTNNAPRAVQTYLKEQDLEYAFEGRIFGRSLDDPRLMKPHPDCLLRAVAGLDAEAADCVMIGDSPADAEAAQRAGVPFVGFASKAEQVARLTGAHTDAPIVVGMEPLIRALQQIGDPDDPPKG